MPHDTIEIHGAREHNLKGIDLTLPRDRLIVITGLSGSGKSSLAFDTIYAEGQRRYVESLSAYARQFLGQMEKPDVDQIDGLSPAISIDQKGASRNPRSTVGTVTEIYDHLRLLFARIGVPHCPNGHAIEPESGRVIPDPDAARLADSIETALRLGEGVVLIAPAARDDESPPFEERRYSERYSCPYDGFTIDDLEPRNFSFNSPHGACPACTGLGTKLEFEPDLLIPDRSKSLRGGALAPWSRNPMDASWRLKILEAVSESHGWSFDAPMRDLPPEAIEYLLRAPKDERVVIAYRHDRGENTYQTAFEGLVTNLERRYRETDSEYVKTELEKFMVARPCPTCGGKRLKPEVLAVTVDDRTIWDVATLPITDALAWAGGLPGRLTERDRTIVRQVLKEITARLGFLVDVGLDYLTIDRTSVSLSGGEAQRIRLATQIGTTLMGVLYILDEPSIGLHQRDNAKLIATLTRLRDLGNTVLVVEHDEETIRTADWVIDIGPGAGEHGGEIIANGRLDAALREPRSVTGAYLRGERAVPVPAAARRGNLKKLVVKGAREHNLRNVDMTVP